VAVGETAVGDGLAAADGLAVSLGAGVAGATCSSESANGPLVRMTAVATPPPATIALAVRVTRNQDGSAKGIPRS
jgi:hypothetical protein